MYFNEFLIPRIFINNLEFFIEANVEGHKKLFQIDPTTNDNIYVITYIIILKVVHFTPKGMKRRFLMEPPIPGCALCLCTYSSFIVYAIVLRIKKIAPLHRADLCSWHYLAYILRLPLQKAGCTSIHEGLFVNDVE